MEFVAANDEQMLDMDCHFKILIPHLAVKHIIGKNGKVVHHLEDSFGTRITTSRRNHFFPGTKEIVCLVTGSLEGVLAVNHFIMQKVAEFGFGYGATENRTTRRYSPRNEQVKILIPAECVPIIIGRRGNNIRRIGEMSGSSVRLTREWQGEKLLERCLTVTGYIDNNSLACRDILQTIAQYTHGNYYLTINYKNAKYPVPNANPHGPAIPRFRRRRRRRNDLISQDSNGQLTDRSGNFASRRLVVPNIVTNDVSQVFEQLEVILRQRSFAERVIEEIVESLNAISRHGVLDICIDLLIDHISGAGTVEEC